MENERTRCGCSSGGAFAYDHSLLFGGLDPLAANSAAMFGRNVSALSRSSPWTPTALGPSAAAIAAAAAAQHHLDANNRSQSVNRSLLIPFLVFFLFFFQHFYLSVSFRTVLGNLLCLMQYPVVLLGFT